MCVNFPTNAIIWVPGTIVLHFPAGPQALTGGQETLPHRSTSALKKKLCIQQNLHVCAGPPALSYSPLSPIEKLETSFTSFHFSKLCPLNKRHLLWALVWNADLKFYGEIGIFS